MEGEHADRGSAKLSALDAVGEVTECGGAIRQLRSVVERGDALEFHFLVEAQGSRRWKPTIHGTAGRQRQKRFRVESDTIVDGRDPADEKGKRHGHLLAIGAEEENLYPPLRSSEEGEGVAVRFFRDRGMLFWSDTGRTGDRSREDGGGAVPTRNMASSQVACVNVMLPLAGSAAALTAAMKKIDPEITEVVPIEHEGRRSLVELEWIGNESSLEGRRTRGANATSVDALVLGRVPGGIRAYLMEWKYVEEGGDTARGDGESGRRRATTYLPLYRQSGLFRARFEDLLFEPVYQLMRFALLGHRMVERRELGVTDFRLVVVCPRTNFAYLKLEDSNVGRLEGYGLLGTAMRNAVLRPEHAHRYSEVAQTDLVSAIRTAGVPGFEAWTNYLSRRYGW